MIFSHLGYIFIFSYINYLLPTFIKLIIFRESFLQSYQTVVWNADWLSLFHYNSLFNFLFVLANILWNMLVEVTRAGEGDYAS